MQGQACVIAPMWGRLRSHQVALKLLSNFGVHRLMVSRWRTQAASIATAGNKESVIRTSVASLILRRMSDWGSVVSGKPSPTIGGSCSENATPASLPC